MVVGLCFTILIITDIKQGTAANCSLDDPFSSFFYTKTLPEFKFGEWFVFLLSFVAIVYTLDV